MKTMIMGLTLLLLTVANAAAFFDVTQQKPEVKKKSVSRAGDLGAVNTGTKTTPSKRQSAKFPSDMIIRTVGQKLPLKMALDMVIPSRYNVQIDPSAANRPVSWENGQKLVEVLYSFEKQAGVTMVAKAGSLRVKSNGKKYKVTPTWNLAKGKLRNQIEGWAQSSGWHVVWQATSNDYIINSPATIKGEFEKAVGQVVETIHAQGLHLTCQIYKGNKTVVFQGE